MCRESINKNDDDDDGDASGGDDDDGDENGSNRGPANNCLTLNTESSQHRLNKSKVISKSR